MGVRVRGVALISIFFFSLFDFSAPQLIGDSISLHLFEPRYRLMVRRVLRTHNEFVYLGDGAYAPAVGAVGLVCRITESKMLPDGRALIVGLFTHRILITAAWTEESSGGLSYCAGLIRLPDGMPWLEGQLWKMVAKRDFFVHPSTAQNLLGRTRSGQLCTLS